jgi:two-component system, NarL family, nitrate/nitrite response regulator NarL
MVQAQVKARKARPREKPPRRVEARAVGSVTRPVKIVIADDHAIFREGLRRLLEGEPAFRVIGDAADGGEAVQLVRQLKPDILLLDMAMPRVPGLQVLDELSASGTPVRTIVLTAAIESSDVVEALQRGARGVLLKEASTSMLFKCIQTVAAGQYWVGREEVGNLVEYMRREFSAVRNERAHLGVTPRELEIVSAIVAGLSNRDMSRRFAISEQTVKHHLTRIYDKLGVSNRLELALYAMQRRLVDEDRH